MIRQPPHYVFDAPGLRPSTRVIHCEPVKACGYHRAVSSVRLDASLRVFAEILEIRVVNDEYIALPVPTCGSDTR